ncbi:MAG: cardiolipin synthase [Gammaproteobacteria bacterium]|nr:cardiolipin synthase [Gammaproteobacteria bacterium]
MFGFEPYLILAITILIDIAVALHILTTKHDEPASAILWLFVVFTFPMVGMALYLLFGINHVRTLGSKIASFSHHLKTEKIIKEALIRENSFVYQNYPKDTHDINYQKTLDRLLPKTKPLFGNKVTLLQDGTSAYPEMLDTIKAAKKYIHLQSYIIKNDATGKELMDALLNKANQGVEVKVIYDAFGSLKAVLSFFFRKYQRKIALFKIRPFTLINLLAPWRIQLRNHRKLLIVDGKTAFIGGINISAENDLRVSRRDKYIHDLHCKIQGPALLTLQISFLRDWHYATRIPLEKLLTLDYFPKQSVQGEAIVRVIHSGPGQHYGATEKIFSTAATNSTSSLWIMTPYFIPDRSFLKTLRMAHARGVDVKIILPKHNNQHLAKLASNSLYKNLLLDGVKIFEKPGNFSHSKAMLIDNKWAVMGSSNCDIRSFLLNYELDFVAEDTEFIKNLSTQFKDSLAASEEITLTKISKKKHYTILLENICSLLTPIM